jgi:hypothetical protein
MSFIFLRSTHPPRCYKNLACAHTLKIPPHSHKKSEIRLANREQLACKSVMPLHVGLFGGEPNAFHCFPPRELRKIPLDFMQPSRCCHGERVKRRVGLNTRRGCCQERGNVQGINELARNNKCKWKKKVEV